MSFKEFTAESVPIDGTQLTASNEGSGSGDPIAPIKSASSSITGTATAGEVIHDSRSVKMVAPSGNYAYFSWPESGLTAVGMRSYLRLSSTTANYTIMAISNGSTYIGKVILTTSGQLIIQDATTTRLTTSALTLPGVYGIDLAVQVGTTTSNGKIKFSVYDVNGNLAAGMSSAFENTAVNTGTTTIANINTGKIDGAATATTMIVDSIKRIDSYSLVGTYTASTGFAATITGGNATGLQATDIRTLTANVTAGSPSVYQWTQLSGPTVSLSGATTSTASYIVPALKTDDTVNIQLRVGDGTTWSNPSIVTDSISKYPIWFLKNESLVAGTFKHQQTPPSDPGTGTITDAGTVPVGTAQYTTPSGALFVATNGSDSAAGTQAAPLATLAKAISLAPAGGTIIMRAGSYNEGTDTQGGSLTLGIVMNKAVTIQNYPGEAVWLDGSTPVTGSWTAGSGTWSTPYNRLFDRSPTFTSGAADGTVGGSGAQGQFLDPSYPCAAWPDMVFYDGTQLEQVDSLAKVTSGKFYIAGSTTTGFWFQGATLYIGDNPSGHQIRFANKTRLAAITGSNVTIQGIGIRRYASSQPGIGAIYAAGPYMTFENVQIEDMACSAMWLVSNNITLRKVTMRRIGFNAVGSNKADNILFDSVDFQQCNYNNFFTGGPAVGIIKIAKCQSVTVTNSILANSKCHGFWTDQTVNHPYVINSWIHDLTGGRAVDFELSSNAILANCKIYNINGVGVFINDSDQVRIWNCTFTNVITGSGSGYVQIGQSDRRYTNSRDSYGIDPRQPSSYYSGDTSHQWVNNGFEVYNSVMARPNGVGRGIFDCESAQDGARPNAKFQPDFNPKMDSNVYFWTSAPQYPFVATLGYQVNPKIYFTLSSFQSGTGLETNGTFVSSNPLDANYNLTDTTLHSKGTGLPADVAALIGQSAGTKHIGTFW